MKCFLNLIFSIFFLLFLTNSVNAQQPVPASTYRQTVVIQSDRKYNGVSIESILPTNDPKGVVVKTKDGKGYFLNPPEAKEKLGIQLTQKGFILPKNAHATYYDENGEPSGIYKNNEYADGRKKTGELIIRDSGNSNQLLYLINGREATKEEADNVPPATIESINVLKGDSTVAAYGGKGKNGVVIITLKKAAGADTAKRIEIVAAFPGGTTAWRRYIEKNLQYPVEAQKSGTKGKVKVSITIQKDGSVTAEPVSRLGYGLEEEAVRVVTASPKWSPATQNGTPVTYRFVQTLTFDMK